MRFQHPTLLLALFFAYLDDFFSQFGSNMIQILKMLKYVLDGFLFHSANPSFVRLSLPQ